MIRPNNRLNIELQHMPKAKKVELIKIVQPILETGMPSMIILYGKYGRGEIKEIIGVRRPEKRDFDIMVLTKDERDRIDLQRKVDLIFRGRSNEVQVLVETIGFTNMQLRERQHFFTEIKEQGIIMFADSRMKLAEAQYLLPARMKQIAVYDFNYWYGEAKNFMRSATYAIADKVYRHAAFLLQQCVEYCYTTIEIVHSRNDSYEHRLSVLRLIAKRYVPEVDTCFPCDTEEGSYLFEHLDTACIASRYPEEGQYDVTQEQLAYWKEETKKLLELTEQACKKKIDMLG